MSRIKGMNPRKKAGKKVDKSKLVDIVKFQHEPSIKQRKIPIEDMVKKIIGHRDELLGIY